MVVFTCNHCGDSVHKPSVEKHYSFACRKYKDLTCVDCFKDFRGEEYAVHTKCLTEDERYAAKGSMPIGVQKKGEAKQEAWVDMIRAIIQEDMNMKPHNKDLLLTISKHNNVPRKKPKFLNYIKSVTGGKVSENTISEVWDIIENYKEKHTKLNKTTNETHKKNESNLNSETIKVENGEKAPKTVKRKDVDGPTEDASPKKKSKKEKSKAAQETEIVEGEDNSLETATPNKKRKPNGIVADADNEQKKNGTLETNKLEEKSGSKKKKQKVVDNKESSSKENENQEDGSLKTEKKKKKNKNTAPEETNLETDKNISELNGKNDSTQLDNSLKENGNNCSLNADKKKKKKDKNNLSEEPNANGINPEINEKNDLTQLDESSIIGNDQENDKSFVIEDVILNILNKKNEISIEKLEKKVTSKYMKHAQETEVSQKFVKKFHKKLKKCEKIEVADNIVRLKNVLSDDQK